MCKCRAAAAAAAGGGGGQRQRETGENDDGHMSLQVSTSPVDEADARAARTGAPAAPGMGARGGRAR